jgi:DnaK suppressor protein
MHTFNPGRDKAMPSKRKLTQEQVKEILSLLLERKGVIENDIKKGFSRYLDDTAEVTTVVDVENGDESHVDVGKELSFQVMSRRSSELKKINDAIARLESGEYGVCEECGNPIRFERLRALPFAQLCRRCQQDSELKEKEREGGF